MCGVIEVRTSKLHSAAFRQFTSRLLLRLTKVVDAHMLLVNEMYDLLPVRCYLRMTGGINRHILQRTDRVCMVLHLRPHVSCVSLTVGRRYRPA